jgi:uncharacterized hydrophobic protein (TIGR00341 family)
MSLRLVEISIPEDRLEAVVELAADENVFLFDKDSSSPGRYLVKLVLHTEDTEGLMERLSRRFSSVEGFRAVILPVDATLPMIEEKKSGVAENETDPGNGEGGNRSRLGVSKEELHSSISDRAKFSWVFITFVGLSTIVAAFGLIRDNIAVVIGAMVIAPLLGPNVGLSLASALGDRKLGRSALVTLLLGMLLALAISFGIGTAIRPDPGTSQILMRTDVHFYDMILALSAGAAGVLAFTSGVSSTLIGVMVAVALLPPLVTLGLMLGSGDYRLASGALLLLITNLICINLAGVAVFYMQGVRPRKWWEIDKARRASRRALAVWSILLAVLVVVIYLSHR